MKLCYGRSHANSTTILREGAQVEMIDRGGKLCERIASVDHGFDASAIDGRHNVFQSPPVADADAMHREILQHQQANGRFCNVSAWKIFSTLALALAKPS